jgi:hypothetical protein
MPIAQGTLGNGTGASGQTTVGTSSGGGGTTTGGDAGFMDVGCAGVYCAPNFECDPVDGICKCGGQACGGNCEADSGTCLVTCPVDAGGDPYPILGSSPNAVMLPAAFLGQSYLYQLQAACGEGPLEWAAAIPVPLRSLELSDQGLLAGKPNVLLDGGPDEFAVRVWDSRGNTGVQNYLLDVDVPDGSD